MAHKTILVEPISQVAFSPFGNLIDCSGAPDKIINQGLCGRYHDRADLDFVNGPDGGEAGISLFQAQLRALPLKLDMVERHPLGSQAFIPMSMDGFLVIVAKDIGGQPAQPMAFQTKPGQVINFHKNIWHGVLTPISGSGLFAVIDRIGSGENLEEYWFDEPYEVVEGQ